MPRYRGSPFIDKSVSYVAVITRIQDAERRKWLRLELVIHVLAASFFIAFLAVQAHTNMRLEVKTALQQMYEQQPFPAHPNSLQSLTFSEITTIQEWKQWFANVLMTTIDTRTGSSAYPPLIFANSTRIRQIRVKPYPTQSGTYCPPFSSSLTAPLTTTSSSNGDCFPSMAGSPTYQSSVQDNNISSPWAQQYSPGKFSYMTSQQSDAAYSDPPVLGVLLSTLDTYPTCGFSATLDTTLGNEILSTNFIDQATRFVAITQLVYSTNYDTFAWVGLWTEFSGGGNVFPSSDYLVGLPYSNDYTEFCLASISGTFMIVGCVTMIYSTYRVVQDSFWDEMDRFAPSMGCRRISQSLTLWVVLDTFRFALNIVQLVYIGTIYWTPSGQRDMSLGNIVYLLHTTEIIQNVFGFSLLLIALKLYKYLFLVPLFVVIDRVLRDIARNVVYVFLMMLLFGALFAIASVMTFGSYVLYFRNVLSSLSTTVRMTLGEDNQYSLFFVSPSYSWPYLLYFEFVFNYCLHTMFLVVVLDGFYRAYQRVGLERGFVDAFRFKVREAWRGGRDERYSFGIWLLTFGGILRMDEDTLLDTTTNIDPKDRPSTTLSPMEVLRRVRYWKERNGFQSNKANMEVPYMSFDDVKSALRGTLRDFYDVTDVEVDAVFRMVKETDVTRTSDILNALNHAKMDDGSAKVSKLLRWDANHSDDDDEDDDEQQQESNGMDGSNVKTRNVVTTQDLMEMTLSLNQDRAKHVQLLRDAIQTVQQQQAKCFGEIQTLAEMIET